MTEVERVRPWERDWTVAALLLLLLGTFAALLSWASEELTASRFFDERHAFRNVRALVVDGRIRPPSALYPSLSYLPYTPLIAASDSFYRSTGTETYRIFKPDHPRWVSKTGYFLGRLISVLAGCACVALTYVAGRRASSPSVGLLAAALLSVTWGFLLVSIKVKPDVVVMLLSLVAFLWSLDAVKAPTAGRLVLAGVGVGLAAAAKYQGVLAALPLVVGALATGGRRLVTWGRLGLASLASLATFLLLNPWPGLIVENVVYQRKEYAARGAAAGGTHWGMLTKELGWLFDEHGALVSAFVLVGCLGFLIRSRVRLAPRADRTYGLGMVSMILGYLLFFAAVTTYFTFQNFVPILPYSSIVAAWAMVAVTEGALRRMQVHRPALPRLLIWVPVAGLVLSVHFSRTYDMKVPTTAEVAQGYLEDLDARRARVVYQEALGSAGTLAAGRDGPAVVPVESVPSLPEAVWSRADALVFRAGRLTGPDATAYSRFLDSWEGRRLRVAPRWFAARGPALEVVLNDWRPVGEPVSFPVPAGRRVFRMPLHEPLRRGELVSIAMRVHGRQRSLLPASLRLGSWGDGPALHALASAGPTTWVVTPKVRVRRRTGEIAVELPDLPPQVIPQTLELYRWRRETS